MRAFDETITWLRFRLDLRQAPPSFWLLLGECSAMIKELIDVPLPILEARELELEMLAKGLHARLAMDGSGLTLEQLQQHLAGERHLTPTKESYLLEADASLHTWQRIIAEHDRSTTSIDLDRIKGFHITILSSSPYAEEAGNWREVELGRSPLDGVPPDVVPLFMEEFCDWMNGPELAPPNPDEQAAYGLIRALIAELYLAWIRPFRHGHARSVAAVMQQILVSSGSGSLPGQLAAHHFLHHAPEFHRQVEQAARGVGDPIPFLAFALRGILEELRALRSRVRSVQASGQWKAHLQDLFGDAEHAPERRQKQLLLELGELDHPIPLTEIPRASTSLAHAYAGVSEKTLRRDIDALENAGALFRGADGVRVRRERLLAFRY